MQGEQTMLFSDSDDYDEEDYQPEERMILIFKWLSRSGADALRRLAMQHEASDAARGTEE